MAESANRRSTTEPNLTTTELLSALATLRNLREELAEWEPRLITAARGLGASWVSLAQALGVGSRQAAERRYLRLRPSGGNETTGEGRVRAERAKRAAERVVNTWARQNSASLRTLAGQVSTAEGLPRDGQRRVDRVQKALGDNDAALLLTPLTDVRAYLVDTHAVLAEKIAGITEHTEQLRRTTHNRRQHPKTKGQ
ncbi:MAG TPA: hypothetical protein VHU91_01645 [Mycobacteriales bacterium]|nr:hypothetical protein [Mycobacteriales bacterium]